MEMSLFWIILALGLLPAAVGIFAILREEHVAQHGGWHKKHV